MHTAQFEQAPCNFTLFLQCSCPQCSLARAYNIHTKAFCGWMYVSLSQSSGEHLCEHSKPAFTLNSSSWACESRSLLGGSRTTFLVSACIAVYHALCDIVDLFSVTVEQQTLHMCHISTHNIPCEGERCHDQCGLAQACPLLF